MSFPGKQPTPVCPGGETGCAPPTRIAEPILVGAGHDANRAATNVGTRVGSPTRLPPSGPAGVADSAGYSGARDFFAGSGCVTNRSGYAGSVASTE